VQFIIFSMFSIKFSLCMTSAYAAPIVIYKESCKSFLYTIVLCVYATTGLILVVTYYVSMLPQGWYWLWRIMCLCYYRVVTCYVSMLPQGWYWLWRIMCLCYHRVDIGCEVLFVYATTGLILVVTYYVSMLPQGWYWLWRFICLCYHRVDIGCDVLCAYSNTGLILVVTYYVSILTQG
jgi:hypothetical protein